MSTKRYTINMSEVIINGLGTSVVMFRCLWNLTFKVIATTHQVASHLRELGTEALALTYCNMVPFWNIFLSSVYLKTSGSPGQIFSIFLTHTSQEIPSRMLLLQFALEERYNFIVKKSHFYFHWVENWRLARWIYERWKRGVLVKTEIRAIAGEGSVSRKLPMLTAPRRKWSVSRPCEFT